ncbi:ALP1-like protein [Tanacetum coccineum]
MSDYESDDSDVQDFIDLDMIFELGRLEQQEQEEAERVHHRNYIYRERVEAEARLMADYFGPRPKYPDYYFLLRYRMSRKLFLDIVSGIENYIETHHPLSPHFDFFRVRPDATGIPGFSVIMKCTSAIRQLAYGVTPDSLDEYLQMGSHCARDCLDFFTMCVIELFMPKYLRKPDFNDIQKLYTAHNNIHGFPGMLGSIDCMHWEWRNCPKAWHGQFGRGDKKYPTILLEAVASYDLWIWHAFFGVAGANNDLTVLNNSPLFDDLLDGIDPVAPFECNGVTFKKRYYLADDIYPQWASFVKSFTVASSEKNVLYKRKQEVARKDIERAFGVLQGRWRIISQPARAWTINKLRRVMHTCIILHNMILEDQKLVEFDYELYYGGRGQLVAAVLASHQAEVLSAELIATFSKSRVLKILEMKLLIFKVGKLWWLRRRREIVEYREVVSTLWERIHGSRNCAIQSGRLVDLRSSVNIDKVIDQGGVNDDILLTRESGIKCVFGDGDWGDVPCHVKDEFRLAFCTIGFEALAANGAKKQQAMVFKVDFDKAYDSISGFFRDVLRLLVSVLMVFWIRGCLHSGNFKRMRRSVVDGYRDNSVQIVDRCRNMILYKEVEAKQCATNTLVIPDSV